MRKGALGMPPDRTVKGLATVALLKVYFDQKLDHVGMFMPFVLDTIRALPRDDFAATEVKEELFNRHGLIVPSPALQTLLSRAKKQGWVRQEGGRYFRNTGALGDGDLLATKAAIDREHAAVAKIFCEFASRHGISLSNEKDALGLLLSFLEENHVTLLIEADNAECLSETPALPKLSIALVAKFLQDVFHSDPLTTSYILRMLEGLVLRNTLLLQDIALANRKFSNLKVFFDTGFLLQALGLEGGYAKEAARETLDLLKANNASLAAFERTIDEIKRILTYYQRLLETPSAIFTIRPTQVTRYLLDNHYTPADIIQVSALIEHEIGQLGIKILPFPERIPQFTAQEESLSQRLKRPTATDLEPRVLHDVNCTAAILTFRAGHTSNSVENAKAVFATTSIQVVKTVRDWYISTEGTGTPPVVHIIGLSNVAWLKKPTAAGRLKQHELIALCSAALRPGEKTWASFIKKLKALQQSGELTSDECVSTVVKSLTDIRLIDNEEGREVEAATVTDIVQRVKEEYQVRAAKQIAVADALARRHEAEKFAAEQIAKNHEECHRQLELRIYSKTNAIAYWCATGLFWSVGLCLTLGAAISLPGIFPSEPWWAKAIAWGLALVFFGFTMASQLWGAHLSQMRDRIQNKISIFLKKWLTASSS